MNSPLLHVSDSLPFTWQIPGTSLVSLNKIQVNTLVRKCVPTPFTTTAGKTISSIELCNSLPPLSLTPPYHISNNWPRLPAVCWSAACVPRSVQCAMWYQTGVRRHVLGRQRHNSYDYMTHSYKELVCWSFWLSQPKISQFYC